MDCTTFCIGNNWEKFLEVWRMKLKYPASHLYYPPRAVMVNIRVTCHIAKLFSIELKTIGKANLVIMCST